jgi:hypothetical protein
LSHEQPAQLEQALLKARVDCIVFEKSWRSLDLVGSRILSSWCALLVWISVSAWARSSGMGSAAVSLCFPAWMVMVR